MKEEQVILVTPRDEPIGLMNKIEAHEKALLHIAFSVFVLNAKGEGMLQQRAHHKYHSPLLWTNTCCSLNETLFGISLLILLSLVLLLSAFKKA